MAKKVYNAADLKAKTSGTKKPEPKKEVVLAPKKAPVEIKKATIKPVEGSNGFGLDSGNYGLDTLMLQ